LKIHWIVLPIGLLAQYVDGSLGMGYGASSASFLLAVGMMPATMSASVHMAEIFSSFASGISHIKLGNVQRSIVIPLTISGVIGGIFGAWCLSSVNGDLFKPYIALLLLLLGVKIIWTFARRKTEPRPMRRIRKSFLIPLGLVGGAVDAIGGGGWGPICTPALAMNTDEPRLAVGSVDTAEFLTTIAITATFAIKLGLGTFLWGITLPLMIGGVIAGPIAAYTCRKIPAGSLGIMIGILLIALNLKNATQGLGLQLPTKMDSIFVFVLLCFALVVILIRTLMSKCRAVDSE
jgi:uncharacterized membrane protein YfcA